MSDLISLRLEKLDDAIEALGEEVRTAGAAAAREPSNAVQLKIYDNLVIKEQTLIQQRGDLQVQLTSGNQGQGQAGQAASKVSYQLSPGMVLVPEALKWRVLFGLYDTTSPRDTTNSDQQPLLQKKNS